MSLVHRTNCRVKPLKSHKSKQGVNMYFTDGILYYADAPVKKVIKYSVDDQDILATLYTKRRPSFMIPIWKKSRLPADLTLQSSVLISDGPQIKIVDLDTKAELDVASIEDIGLEGQVGSAAIHHTGRLFFSVIQTENDRPLSDYGGSLCCMKPSGRIQKLYDGVCLADGVCFSKDCSRLFGVDSTRNRIVYFCVDPVNITSPITFINWSESPLVENSQVRGMIFDTSDHLWMCCSGEGKVIQVDLETKSIIKEISTPKAKELSSMCFGGSDYRELFIASSYIGLTQEELTKQINAGHIFSAKGYTSAKGKKPTPVFLDMPDAVVHMPSE